MDKFTGRKGYLNEWSAKVAKKIYKIPTGVLGVCAAAGMLLHGLSLTWYNENSSKLIASGFSQKLFITFIQIQIVLAIADRINTVTMRSITMKIVNNEYIKIFNRILNSKIHNILKVSTGKIFDASKQIACCKTNRISYLFNLIPCIIPFVGLIIKEYDYNPILALVSIGGTVIGGVCVRLIEKMFAWSRDAAAIKGEMQSITVDNFMNIPTIKYSNRNAWAIKRLTEIQDEAYPYTVNVGKHLMYSICVIFMWAPTIINTYLARHDVEMMSYVLLSDYVMNRISNQIMTILDNEIEIKSNENIINELKGDDVDAIDELSESLDLSGAKFAYEADKNDMGRETIVFEVGENVTVDPGETVLVVGPSGGGKSTILNAIAGSIRFMNGLELPKLKTFYSWQETCLFNTTLKENILSILPIDASDEMKDMIMKQADKMACLLNLQGLLNKLPEGWDSRIGEKGYLLSSGQKQRFLIIIACLHMKIYNGYMYLLDEITSNLDDATREVAIKLIQTCSEEKTCIIVSHNPGFEEMSDKIVRVTEDHKFNIA